MKVVENYIKFPAVHSFDVEKFEFSVPANFVIMTWSVYKIFLSSEYEISKHRAVKVGPGWASAKTDPTFTTE